MSSQLFHTPCARYEGYNINLKILLRFGLGWHSLPINTEADALTTWPQAAFRIDDIIGLPFAVISLQKPIYCFFDDCAFIITLSALIVFFFVV